MSAPIASSTATDSLEHRVSTWGPAELARWARAMAVESAQAGSPLSDAVFDLTSHGKTDAERYLRASDPSYWRRAGARKLRIAQEARALAAGAVGKHAARQYSSESAAGWLKHSDDATKAFLNVGVVYNHDRGFAVPLSDLVKSDHARVSRFYAQLKGIQTLADEANLRWAMLTVTLPSEYHAAPANRRRGHRWNGVTPDESHKLIAESWNRITAAVRKHGLVLSGVRTEEPQGDATPHWHCAFFYRDDTDLHHVCRAVLRQFPAGLRVRESSPGPAGGLTFSAKQYRSLSAYDEGKYHRNTREGAQCQIDIGAKKTALDGSDGIRSFASYLLKYVSKAVGSPAAVDSADDKDTISESGDAQAIRAHRQTYGIRAIQFFGLPRAFTTAWDLLRQVQLEPSEDKPVPPPHVATLAALCQREKGQGMTEYLRLLGGLAVAPLAAQYRVKPLTCKTTTRHGAKGSKLIGLEVRCLVDGAVECFVFKGQEHQEILRDNAAAAVSAACDVGVVKLIADGATAAERGLVQIGTTQTFDSVQRGAITADLSASHTVLAAAGSGKTHVLVERVKYLLRRKVPASSILITTFTREAAEGIRARLMNDAVQVGTMHSLAGFQLSAAGQSATCLDDVISAAAALGRQDKHILLDEAQDLSPDQWAWARAHGKTLYAVGDHRQAIYSWRNAQSGALAEQARSTGGQLDFFSPGGEIHLPFNRRSAAAVVALGNALMPDAAPAHALIGGGSVKAVQVPTVAAELEQVLDFVSSSAQGSCAVLARTNTEVARIKSTLVLAGFADVPVMTIHASKGLEFDRVCLSCGHRKPSESGAESRETYYVAATRAKATLLVTSVGAYPTVLETAFARFG
jgi:Bacteriophage replication gene A protein (GPA)/AAA domain/UvrD-like helicase C-terminal domain